MNSWNTHTVGHINLQDLKLLHVQRFLNQCKDQKNLAQKTVKNIYLVLNKALKKAQSQGLIRQNPCGEAEIPSYDTPQKEMRPLKDEEVAQFLKQIAGHPDEFFLYMALFTGMRESELIGLTWDCIDCKARMLTPVSLLTSCTVIMALPPFAHGKYIINYDVA